MRSPLQRKTHRSKKVGTSSPALAYGITRSSSGIRRSFVDFCRVARPVRPCSLVPYFVLFAGWFPPETRGFASRRNSIYSQRWCPKPPGDGGRDPIALPASHQNSPKGPAAIREARVGDGIAVPLSQFGDWRGCHKMDASRSLNWFMSLCSVRFQGDR